MKLVINRCIAQLIIQASVSSVINHRLFTRVVLQRNPPTYRARKAPGIGIEDKDKQRQRKQNVISEQVCSCGRGDFTSWKYPELLPV